MSTCQVEDCSQTVSRAGFELCLHHWKAERAGKVIRCEKCRQRHENQGSLCRACAEADGGANHTASQGEDDSPAGFLSSTKIGRHFGLSSMKVNLILAELGWIERYVKGWVPTDRGN